MPRMVCNLITVVGLLTFATPLNGSSEEAAGVLTILEQARQATATLKDSFSKAVVLQAIAEGQAAAGDIKGALHTVANIQGDNVDYPKASALGIIALAQIAGGNMAEAHQTAAAIFDGFFQAQVLTAIAAAQAKAGDGTATKETFEKAVKIARTLTDAPHDYGTPRGSTLIHIAASQGKAGYIGEAMQTAMLLSDPEQAATMVRIGQAQAEAGDLKGAYRTAAAMQHGYDKASILVAIAKAKARAGDRTAAINVLMQARQAAGPDAPYVLEEIAKSQAAAGDINGALQTTTAIGAVGVKASALVAIVKAQVKAGDLEGARRTAASIKDDGTIISPKDHALRAIAEAQAESGDLKGAIEIAASIKDQFDKDLALRAIAKAQAAGGDVKSALRTTLLIQYDNYQAEAWEAIVRVQVKAKDVKGAFQIADAIKREDLKGGVLAAIAEAQAQAGDVEGAHKPQTPLRTTVFYLTPWKLSPRRR